MSTHTYMYNKCLRSFLNNLNTRKIKQQHIPETVWSQILQQRDYMRAFRNLRMLRVFHIHFDKNTLVSNYFLLVNRRGLKKSPTNHWSTKLINFWVVISFSVHGWPGKRFSLSRLVFLSARDKSPTNMSCYSNNCWGWGGEKMDS